jgi:nucleoside-diphosphate-sugar epimerase/glycosyltransferase involved in cell wall biosynthesis
MIDMRSEITALRGPILVLGAAGFVGANLFRHLSRFRDDVYAVVRDEKSWRLRDVEDEKVIACDLNDHSAAKHLVQTIGPQTVFDCVAYGAYSFEDKADLIYRTNFNSMVHLVELLLERRIAAFVHAGTSSEYGLNCTAPSEDGPCEPNSHYAVSKVAAAKYLQWVGKQKAFPCVNLRLYSVYGPLEDTSRLIPNIVRLAQQGHLPPLVDPRTSRDFVHVDDACAAFVTAAVRMHPSLYGEDFNIGSGARTTIAELASLVREQFGVQEEPKYGSMEGRAWDLADWYADPAKTQRLLGWTTRISLADGLNSTAGWIRTLSDSDVAVATKKNAAGKRRSLAAVIACYKDGQAIPVMHERLTATFRKLGIDYEIIFVNDGSPDDSAEVIRAISERDPRVLGITHSRNFGSQMAFRSGMELSTKDGVVLLDGDLQDPPELIERFYEQWLAGHEVVYGRRVKRDMPWHWGLMYKAFYRVFAAFSYVNIPLDAGDFALMDKRVVSWLLKFPERDLFMRGLRAYVGFRQTGVDYVRPERMFGVSTNNLLKNIDWAKKGIFSFSNTPLTMLTALGIVSLGVSLLAAAISVVLRILFPDIAPRGVTTLLITILVFGSLNLFAVGLIGEYVAKIMTEVKRRPPLIRSAFTRSGRVTDLLPDGKEAGR